MPNQNVVDKIARFENKIYLSSIVWQELLFGVNLMPDGKRKQIFWQYFHHNVLKFPMLVYDKNCADINAKIRANCQKQGKTLSYYDSQIASMGLIHNLIIVTRNIDDFKYIDGLIVENWFEE